MWTPKQGDLVTHRFDGATGSLYTPFLKGGYRVGWSSGEAEDFEQEEFMRLFRPYWLVVGATLDDAYHQCANKVQGTSLAGGRVEVTMGHGRGPISNVIHLVEVEAVRRKEPEL